MAIGIQAKAQAMVQKALANKQKQEAASTAATQSGSTSTPTTASTPKVTQPAKTTQATTQVQTTQPIQATQPTVQSTAKLNLFDIKAQTQQAQQIQQTPQDLLSPKAEAKDIQQTTIPTSTVKTAMQMGGTALKAVANTLYEQGVDYIKQKVGETKLGLQAIKQGVDLFGEQYKKDIKQLGSDIKTEFVPQVASDIKKGKAPGFGTVNTVFQGITKGGSDILYWLSDYAGALSEKQAQAANVVLNKLGLAKGDITQGINFYGLRDFFGEISDFYANTELADYIKETSTIRGVLENPGLHAAYTLGQMTPTLAGGVYGKVPGLINAITGIYGQSYTNLYRDWSEDDVLSQMNPDQFRAAVSITAVPDAIIEFLGDLFEEMLPFLSPGVELGQKELSQILRKPLRRAITKFIKGGISEGIENPAQEEVETRIARGFGSKRELPTWKERLQNFAVSSIIGFMLQGGNIKTDIEAHKDLEKMYKEWGEGLGELTEGMTEEEKKDIFTATLEYKIKNTPNAKSQEEAMYNDTNNTLNTIKTDIEEKINTTTDSKQLEILKTTLNKVNDAIESVNKIHEEWAAIIDNVLQEEPQIKQVQQVAPTQQGGENLSEQSMRTVESTKYKLDSKTQYELSNLTSIREGYGKKSIEKNKIGQLLSKLVNMTKEEAVAELAKYNKQALYAIAQEAYDISYGKPGAITQQQSYDIGDYINSIGQYVQDTVKEIEQLRKRIPEEELMNIKTPEEFRTATGRGLTSFVIRDSNYSKHLLGLKNVNIKNLKGDITDETARKFGQYVAKFSQILGIDFNKVLNNIILNVTQNDNKTAMGGEEKSSGFLGKYRTKEQLEDLVDRLGDEAKIQQYERDEALEGIIKAGIYVAKKDVSEADAVATLAHEFFHLLDLKYSIDQGFPVIQREFQGDIIKDWISMIDMDNSWKTFKTVGITSPNDVEYYNDYTEILSRYAEQYVLYKMWKDMGDMDAKEMFENYTRYVKGYWTEEAFKDLIPKFEDLLENRLEDYRLDIGNQSYYDVMMKMDEYKNTSKLDDDKSWMMDIARRLKGVNFDDDVHKEMLNMQKEYVVLSEEFDGLEGAIGEELRGEYATTLDWLKQNMYMLADLGKEYMEFTSKRIKLDDVKSSDEATQSNMKDMPNTEEENNEENGQLETDDELQEETDIDELDEEKTEEKEKLNTPEEDLNALEEEKKRQRKGEYKKNSIEARRDIRAAAKDILTPTMTRIYNINKRIAGRLTQMETQTGINIYRYTQKSQGFVDTYNKLSKAQQLEVSMALFDFGALAKEQTEETIQEYKENERKKLRDVLSKNGFNDDDINSMFEVLNDLGTRYKESGMEITLSDMYFPRTVTDYEGLINYLNDNSEKRMIDKNVRTLYSDIQKITNDPNLTIEQKNAEIANKLSQNFTPRVSTKTKYAKEKKLGLLSDWGAGIYAYYANPVDSLASYITSMEQSIQRRLFLWGMKETEGIETDIEGQTNDESVSEIVRTMFEKGQITESQMNELHTSLMAILNKKGTPRRVRTIKNITYTMALTNYISAMNQAEDLGVAIVENKKGLKSVVKSIFTKAGIQYDDAGLESAYEMFKTNSGLSDTLFKKSGFNAIDRVGKRSFLNAAWRSMVETYKEPKARGHMYERLVAMYGDKTANRIMECVRTNNYMVGKKGDQQIDIDVLTDLLYQLGNTQPIYQSAMPVAYLQHPEVRWLYSLSMFSLRQIDHIIQSTKSAYERGGFKNAAAVALWLVATRMFFNALIGDIGDLLKGDLDESWMWKLFEGDLEGAGEKFGADFLKGFGKIWMFSDYDRKKRKNEGFWAFAANRVYPYIFQEMYRGRKSVQNALKNDDRTELMTMLNDVPLLGKQAYGRWDYFRGDTEKSKKKVGGKIKKESSGKKKVGGKL